MTGVHSAPARVLLVDDHPVVRAGVRALLEAYDDIEVVAEATSGEQALAVYPRVQPNVVLMDLRMPGLDGVAATARITAAYPGARVLVLTTYDTDTDIIRAVEAAPPATCSRTRLRSSWPQRCTQPHAEKRCLRPRSPQSW